MLLIDLPASEPGPAAPALLSAGLPVASEHDFEAAYDMAEELGRGAMSVVYAARRRSDDTAVAVKLLQKRNLFAGNERAPERLRDELRALAALRHPHIVTLHETFEDEEELLIVMERAEGGELFDRIVEHGSFSEPHARQVMAQVLSAIDYMHSQGVVHRDIKPENLLLTSTTGWHVKVSDFGLVKMVDNFGEVDDSGDADGIDAVGLAMSRLRTTTLCGSSYYMAPEVYWQRSHGAAVDVWSAGIVLYILLCGSPPWDGDHIPEKDGGSVPFFGRVWGGVSVEAKQLLRGMLQVEPETRLTPGAALASHWLNDEERSNAANSVSRSTASSSCASFDADAPTSARATEHSRASRQSLNDLSGGDFNESFRLFNAKRARSRADSAVRTPARGAAQRFRFRSSSAAAAEASSSRGSMKDPLVVAASAAGAAAARESRASLGPVLESLSSADDIPAEPVPVSSTTSTEGSGSVEV